MTLTASGMTITADVDMYLDTEAPVEITWPETEKDLSELDNSVLQTAIAPLTEYIGNLQAAA